MAAKSPKIGTTVVAPAQVDRSVRADTAELGQSVGSYRILSKLSAGGMGVVYRAEHGLMGKLAAVKVLHPELSSNQDIVQRFFNEAKAATAIRHPGIVEVFDFGYTADGMAFIVMELLDGEPLSKRLAARGKLPEREALSLLRGIASALAAAHAKGIIHRDLKPDNIFLVPDPDMVGGERPKLLDFGIAKLTDRAQAGEMSQTRTGAVMGTPTYMSPEQCRGAGEIDPRSDLYALGCILYEMVCGRPPFTAEGVGELIGYHLYMAPTPPSQLAPGLSVTTEGLISNLLAKKPEDRVQTAIELARMLGHGSTPVAHTFAFAEGVKLPTAPGVVAHGTVSGRRDGVATQVLTTLTGAASEAAAGAPTGRKRGGRFAGLAILLACAGIAGGVLATRVGGGDRDRAASGTPRPAVVSVDAGVEVVAVPVDAAPIVEDATDAAAAVVIEAPPRSPKKPRPPKRPRPPEPPAPPPAPTGPTIETDL